MPIIFNMVPHFACCVMCLVVRTLSYQYRPTLRMLVLKLYMILGAMFQSSNFSNMGQRFAYRVLSLVFQHFFTVGPIFACPIFPFSKILARFVKFS